MKNILLLLSLALILSSCEDYLDKIQDSDGMTDEEVFTDYLNFRRFNDRIYRDMHNYLNNWDLAFTAAMSDEGWLGPGWETMPTVQQGDWLRAYNLGQALNFYGVWNAWRSIRQANISLQNIHMLEGNATQQQIDEIKGQAHFMRAWYYFEFLKRQGGMPYITEVFESTDNFALPRLSYHETALKIVADCDTAAALLPQRWSSDHIGRPEVGSAMALKAAALLFSASPTNNPGNDMDRWEAAAQASWDVISYARSTGRYQLLQSNGTDQVTYMTPGGVETIEYPSGFDSIFKYLPHHDEVLWENYPAVTQGSLWRVFSTPSYAVQHSVIQGFSPSANIVDHFETANGLSVHDDPDHDPQNPYVNRDPRFYHSILFNQQRWGSATGKYLELWSGGEERQTAEFYSVSGYLARKYWAPNRDDQSGLGAPPTRTIYFRLAEIYLMYAEAANEIGGPNHTISGADLSAVEAVNIVRERVGMPPVHSNYLGSKEAFRERIKNERAVELYLEGKRLFDLMRWGDAHRSEHRQLFARNYTEDPASPTGFSISTSDSPFVTYTFEQRHYRWPIPLSDALMFEEFEQNPGW